MRCLGMALPFALVACATVPSTSVPRPFERFAAACQFVPPDMLSFSFREEELDPEAAGLPATAARRIWVVRGDRDFAAPPRYGYGKFRGVQVFDFGPRGATPYAGLEKELPIATIAGIPVWFTPEESKSGYIAPSWSAWVDDRFLVMSSERETLAQALARTGRLDRLLQPFAAARQLADDASEIVCVLPRPGDQTYWGRVVPIEPVVTAVQPDPWRLQAFHQQALPPEYGALFDILGDPTQRSSRQVKAWTLTEVRLQEQAPLWKSVNGGLVFELLFGLAVFI